MWARGLLTSLVTRSYDPCRVTDNDGEREEKTSSGARLQGGDAKYHRRNQDSASRTKSNFMLHVLIHSWVEGEPLTSALRSVLLTTEGRPRRLTRKCWGYCYWKDGQLKGDLMSLGSCLAFALGLGERQVREFISLLKHWPSQG